MRLGYADPPYYGCGKLYAEHHPNALDWDDHVTSKRGKPIQADLHLAPMVMEEFSLIAGVPVKELRREMLPASAQHFLGCWG